jgi:hypothetical protein
MSLKLSPGCKCCDDCGFCSGTVPDEFDATITGFVDGAMCIDCSDLDGIYSLQFFGELDQGCRWKYSATSAPAGKVATCDGYSEWITDIYLDLLQGVAGGSLQWALRIHLNAASSAISCDEDAGGSPTSPIDCNLDAFDFTGCFWWDPEFHCGLSSFGVSVSVG